MRSTLLTFVTFFSLFFGKASTEQCLHDQGEANDQSARRREALIAARTINSIEANQPGAPKGVYLRQEQLNDSPFAVTLREGSDGKPVSFKVDEDIVPGWKLTLDVTEKGYWFIIKDTSDPCGFSYVSNQTGSILKAEPIR